MAALLGLHEGDTIVIEDSRITLAFGLRHDFWTNEDPGFAPLLYAMGASAAAFSACRRAVLGQTSW